jgi:hypothetical protein
MQGRTETSDERGVAQKVPLLAKNALQERGRVEGVEATAQCDTIQDYPAVRKTLSVKLDYAPRLP